MYLRGGGGARISSEVCKTFQRKMWFSKGVITVLKTDYENPTSIAQACSRQPAPGINSPRNGSLKRLGSTPKKKLPTLQACEKHRRSSGYGESGGAKTSFAVISSNVCHPIMVDRTGSNYASLSLHPRIFSCALGFIPVNLYNRIRITAL